MEKYLLIGRLVSTINDQSIIWWWCTAILLYWVGIFPVLGNWAKFENGSRPKIFWRSAAKLSAFVALLEYYHVVSPVPPSDPPFWGNLGGKAKLWPQISPPPRGVGGYFRCQKMPPTGPSLSSKPPAVGPLPEFLGNFFPKFRIFWGAKGRFP